MAIKREQLIYIQCCALVSLILAILLTISLATNNWIVGTAEIVENNDSADQHSSINYGLFKGHLTRRLLESPKDYEIYLTCIWGRNVCMWSCQEYSGLRKAEISQLLANKNTGFYCPSAASTKTLSTIRANTTDQIITKDQFLNSGMFLTTLISAVITAVSLYCGGVLAIVNCYISPTISLLNINGLWICFSTTFIFNFLTLVIFGCNYDYWISNNIGIFDTIVGDYKSTASLGYSYWICLVSNLICPILIGMLYVRERILMKFRAETVIVVAKTNDPTTVLY